MPQARFTAIDISPAALDVARSNAAAHAVGERIEWVQSDLFDAVSGERRFDFVVSNPPYVTEAEMAALPPEVRNHEPHGALCGGPDGLAVDPAAGGPVGRATAPGGDAVGGGEPDDPRRGRWPC